MYFFFFFKARCGGAWSWGARGGVMGANTYTTEGAMAGSVGSIIFVVVVVGGIGSLAGAFLASLLIGLVQTFAVAMDGIAAQAAPILPYLLLVLMLVFRPQGLLGARDA